MILPVIPTTAYSITLGSLPKALIIGFSTGFLALQFLLREERREAMPIVELQCQTV